MPEEQNINRSRYKVIPRVIVFVTRGEEILLLKIAPRNGRVTRWTGRYNGLGGHIERGEDSLTAARRELLEEAGVTANLRLCGLLIVNADEDVGIELHIFSGEYVSGALLSTHEGIPEWIPLDKLDETPLVDDGPVLIAKILAMQPGDPPFCARSFYDENGLVKVVFGE
jgi:8-oxo-dGTP diphosphatase